MKKSFLCACLVFSLFMFTGCSRVTLKCEKEIEENIIFNEAKQKITVGFKDDVIYKLDYYTSYNFTDDSIGKDNELIDKMAESVSSEWSEITGKDGVYYSISKYDTVLWYPPNQKELLCFRCGSDGKESASNAADLG